MRQKLPTLLILLVMALLGAVYWLDLSYYTDPVSGFVVQGPILLRYAVLAVPALMCLLGLRTVGPRAISVLRTKNPALARVFVAAAVVGVAYGITRVVVSLQPMSTFGLVVGALFIWYGVWMFLVALQLFSQTAPSPTKHAIWGVLAAVPFSPITVYRILVRPSTLYRVGPLARALAALLAMLWFGLLLRALYIALPRRRVRWMYLAGMFTFLFATCLELPYAVFMMIFGEMAPIDMFESLNMAVLGLAAGGVSVAIAGKSSARQAQEEAPPADA
ncbi:MAG: hypothetical protein AB7V55_05285 [Oscillospiraceae bacterium]